MGDKNENEKNRRWFLSLLSGKSGSSEKEKPAMVKMLTADGKLVEVDKAIFDKATNRQKASNKDIYDWMKNPSKDKI